jgi:hypothetical protein
MTKFPPANTGWEGNDGYMKVRREMSRVVKGFRTVDRRAEERVDAEDPTRRG